MDTFIDVAKSDPALAPLLEFTSDVRAQREWRVDARAAQSIVGWAFIALDERGMHIKSVTLPTIESEAFRLSDPAQSRFIRYALAELLAAFQESK